jgi:hypothetical protein
MLEEEIKEIEDKTCLKKRTRNNSSSGMYSFYCAYSDSNNPCNHMRLIDGLKGYFCSALIYN